MGEIKSALELALERTKDIKGDPEALARYEAKQDGKRLLAKLQEEPGFDVKKAIKAVDKPKRQWVREGLFEVLLTSINLPTDQGDLDRLTPVERGLAGVIDDRRDLSELMEQVRGLFKQYLDNREQLIESIRSQYEGRIREREQQLAQQYGRQIRLDPSSDPEYQKAVQHHLGGLKSRYDQVVTQVRDQLRQMFH
ncbi:MAG: DUF6657 family protein [Alkalispirochaetaceae bacterium]